jgi:hypothetical protein
MSLREDIAKEVVRVLQTIDDPAVKLVTREPFSITDLPITQFPALLIQTANENRETITQGSVAGGFRQGVITYAIRGFVRGVEIDRLRNDLIEAVEEALDSDRRLGLSAVQDSQVINVDIIDRLAPLGELLITFDVRYAYARGTL